MKIAGDNGCFSIAGVGDVCEKLSHIKAPSDLVHSGLLGVFGPGLIVVLFLVVNAVLGWIGAVRVSLRASRAAVGAGRRLSELEPSSAAALIASIVVVLGLQTAWVYLGFYVGNSVSVLTRTHDQDFPTLSQIPGLLRWDVYSQAWVLASALGLAVSYRQALKSRTHDGLATFFALPGFFYGFCGLLGGVINGGMYLAGHAIDGVDPTAITYMFTVGIAGAFYVFATRYALSASTWLVRVCRRPTSPRQASTRRSSTA